MTSKFSAFYNMAGFAGVRVCRNSLLSKQVLLPVRCCFTKRMCHTVEMHCVFSEPA